MSNIQPQFLTLTNHQSWSLIKRQGLPCVLNLPDNNINGKNFQSPQRSQCLEDMDNQNHIIRLG
jgi:hypothetical protein